MTTVARPSTQKQRRQSILDAAERLMEDQELAVLRISDIASELGMTPNAIRYYYEDIDQLYLELCDRSNERFYTRRKTVSESIEDPAQRLAVTIAAGLPSGPEDAEWRVIWRAVMAAGFEFDRRPAVSEIYHRQVGLYESIFEYGASCSRFTLAGRPRDLARSIMAMEDYLGYRIVARDPVLNRPVALSLVRGYAQLATGIELPEVS